MKKILFPLALACLTTGVSAETRSAEEALAVAQQFVQNAPQLASLRTASFKLASSAAVSADKHFAKRDASRAYYIYNVGDNACVIVSGDDCFTDILGYTTNGTVAENGQLPDGMAYWLRFLEKEMTAAKAAGYDRKKINAASASCNALVSVDQMLTTQWAQNAPYNNMLMGNMVGCAATGAAQVMRYWKYPEKGVGSHQGAYAPNFSADFGTTTYDWDHMLDTYGTGWESKEELDAVATLMMHLGVATDMHWGKSESATSSAYVSYALANYFRYNPNMYIESRDHMSLGAWKALLINQLQTGHPLCYWGSSEESGGKVGHFFVCDGYDAHTGYFHFNWGWAGYCDGYYAVTALEPGTGGIGAGAGTYNTDQCILVNLQPEKYGDYLVHFDAKRVEISGSNKADIKVSTNALANNNTYNLVGSMGLAVYKEDGTLLRYVPSDFTLPYSSFGIGSVMLGELSFNVNLSDVSDGTYVVCAAAYSNREEKAFPIRAQYANTTYYLMTISAGKVSFSAAPKNAEVSSAKVEMATADNVVYQGGVASFQVTVTNHSAIDFDDEIGVSFEQSRSKKGTIAVPAHIAAGETKVVEVRGILPSAVNTGSAAVKAVYGVDGTYNPLGSTLNVQVETPSTGIQGVTDAQRSAATFNLHGQRANSSHKGIIIKNGKKYIRK